MKKLTAAQIQNIVFTAIVAIAAVCLYLLTGVNAREKAAAALTPTPSSTPTVSAEPTPTPKPRVNPVAQDAFLSELAAAPRAHVGKGAHAGEYALLFGDTATGTATLSCDVNTEGGVTAFTLRFPRLEEPGKKPKNNVEQFHQDMYEVKLSRQNEAIQGLLFAALMAADGEGLLTEPVRLSWYTGVLRARDNGKYYSDTYLNCDFLAYPSTLGGEDVIICSLNLR